SRHGGNATRFRPDRSATRPEWSVCASSPGAGRLAGMPLPPPSVVPGSGLIQLLNTAGGRVLCLAGDVDDRSVDSFLRRYGREPMPVDGIDAGSVTHLSLPALDLVLDHLAA